MGLKAEEYARELGVRSEWAQYAVWSGRGIRQPIFTYPSIRIGKGLRNECMRISTPNDLYVSNRDHGLVEIPKQDLEWLETEMKSPVDLKKPFSQMYNTRLELLLNPEMIVPNEEFPKRCEHLFAGLHSDLEDAIAADELEVFVIPEEASLTTQPILKFLDLWRVASVRTSMGLSSDQKHFEPQGDQIRRLYGLTGLRNPREGRIIIESVFVGQRYPTAMRYRGWIAFFPVEVFDQLYLTWLHTMVGLPFREHLRLYGLNIPMNGHALIAE